MRHMGWRQRQTSWKRRASISVCMALVVGVSSQLIGASADAAATNGPFHSATLLPAGIGYLNGIDCPNADLCYMVGSDTQSPSDGIVLTATPQSVSSQLAGAWMNDSVAPDLELTSISCWDAAHCFATGFQGRGTSTLGEVVGTFDAPDWAGAGVVVGDTGAPPSAALTSVSCVPDFCMAVAAQPSGSLARVWVTPSNQTGSDLLSWHAISAPTSGTMFDVSCDQPQDCWVVGGGVWHTSDAGQTWTDVSPPMTPSNCSNGCAATYSNLTSVQFADPTHGLVAGTTQCGGVDIPYCPGAIFRTSDGGQTWTLESDPSTPAINDFSCVSLLSGPCVAVAATYNAQTGNYSGDLIVDSSDAVHWTQLQTVSGPDFTSVSCPGAGICTMVGGIPAANGPAVYSSDAGLDFALALPASPPSAPLALTSGCTLGTPAAERAGATFATQWWALVGQGGTAFDVSPLFNGLYDIEHGQDARAGNANWLAGFFDTVARPFNAMQVNPGVDPLNNLLSNITGASGGGAALASPQMGFADPQFYTALDCALSSGLTSFSLSRDLLSQTGFLLPATGHPLVSGLLQEQNACVGLFEHLPASEIFADFGAGGPSQISDSDSAGYAALATAALTANSVQAAPAELGAIVPSPFGPWRPGALSRAQVAVLTFIADHTTQGFRALAGPLDGDAGGEANSLIRTELADTALSGDAVALAGSYEQWIARAAALNVQIDAPEAAMLGAGWSPASIPDMSIPVPPSQRFGFLPTLQGTTRSDLADFDATYGTTAAQVTVDGMMAVVQAIRAPSTALAAEQTIQALLGEASGQAVDICPPGRVSGCSGGLQNIAVSGGDGTPSGLTLADFATSYYSDIDDVISGAAQYGVIDLTNGQVNVPPLGTVLDASRTSAEPQIIDSQGDAVLVRGLGFAAHTPITIGARSARQVLASGFTDGQGHFILSVSVHGKLDPGSYTMTATGKSKTGAMQSVSAIVDVIGSAAPHTGSAWLPWAPIGGVAALLLVAAFAWRRPIALRRLRAFRRTAARD